MKIKAIEQIIKAAKRIVVFEVNGCQWIGDGRAAYPLYDLPNLKNGEFFALFDIPDDKRSKFYFKEQDKPEGIDFSDNSEDERILAREYFAIMKNRSIYEPLPSIQGITFIEQRYLKPFKDEEDGIYLTERISADGRPYIAVKNGLFLLGIIIPSNIVNKDFVNLLQKITFLSENYLSSQKGLGLSPSEDTEPEQITLNNKDSAE